MFIVFNIPLCDYGNEILTDITDTKQVRSRNKARDRVRAKVMKIFFFHKGMFCNIFYDL